MLDRVVMQSIIKMNTVYVMRCFLPRLTISMMDRSYTRHSGVIGAAPCINLAATCSFGFFAKTFSVNTKCLIT